MQESRIIKCPICLNAERSTQPFLFNGTVKMWHGHCHPCKIEYYTPEEHARQHMLIRKSTGEFINFIE